MIQTLVCHAILGDGIEDHTSLVYPMGTGMVAIE